MSSTILWKATGSKHGIWSKDGENDLSEKPIFFLGSCFPLVPSVVLSKRHSYTIVEPFMDHQLTLKQYNHLLYIFHPWNLVVPDFQTCRWNELIIFWSRPSSKKCFIILDTIYNYQEVYTHKCESWYCISAGRISCNRSLYNSRTEGFLKVWC